MSKQKPSLIVKMPFPEKDIGESSGHKSRFTLWREKKRTENPEKYNQLKKTDRERKRKDYYREQEDQSREGRYKRKLKREIKSAQQNQRRAKQKLANESKRSTTSDTSDIQSGTRSEKKNQKQYMRDYMRKRRANTSRQKQQAIKEKDRKRKTPTAPTDALTPSPLTGINTGFKSRATKHRKCKNLQPHLPDTPEKFAEVIDSVLNTSTPKKVKALEERGITATKDNRKHKSLLDELVKETKKLAESCKQQKTDASRIVQRSLNQSVANIVCKKYGYNKEKKHSWNYAAKKFGITWRQKKKTSQKAALIRKKRSDAITKRVETMVGEFYCSPQVSQTRPDQKLGKSGKPTYIMHLTFVKAYHLWKKDNLNIKLGLTKFHDLKPKNVKTISNTRHIACLCVYCVNIQENLKAIDYKIRFMQKEEDLKESRIGDEKQLYDMLLCEKPNENRFHNPQCVYSSCEECNNYEKTMMSFYDQFIKEAGSDKISWKKWETKKVKFPKKEGKQFVEKEATRRVLTNKEGTANELIREFIGNVVSPTQGVTFVTHLFNASWQIHQVEKVLKEKIRKEAFPGGVMVIQDFGRNFSAKYQDEIKSAHWVKKEVTVHPMVAYYVDPVTRRFTRDSMVMLSDDLTHDHHIVAHFQQIAHNHLKVVRGLDIQLLVQINDGCASQYKKASAFADVSFSVDDFGYAVERGFYGSEHGKGESDGETSVVKGQAENAILSRKAVITTGETMYEFCTQNLTLEGKDKGTHLSKRSFFLIKKGDVNRNRQKRCEGLKSVVGTRKLHSVRTTQAGPFTIRKKRLSCFCTHCLEDKSEKCTNAAYTANWIDVNLKPAVDKQKRKAVKQNGPSKKTVKSGTSNRLSKLQTTKTNPQNEQVPHQSDVAPAADAEESKRLDTTPTTSTSTSFGPGDIVAVMIFGKHKQSPASVYIAEVVVVQETSAVLKYMTKQGTNLYQWPHKEDQEYSTEPLENMVVKLGSPVLVNQRQQLKFNDISKIHKIMNTKKIKYHL